MVDNKFIPKIKLFNQYDLTYTEVFDAYYKINERINSPYKFLISNRVFDVSILKQISSVMTKEKNRELKRKEEEKYRKLREKFGSADSSPRRPPQNNLNANQPPRDLNANPNTTTFNLSQQQSQYIGPFYNRMHQNNNRQVPQQPRPNPPVERPNRNGIQFTFIAEEAKELLRIFNFAFNYYVSGPPSMYYYYPFQSLPPFTSAVKAMKQESISFFDSIDDENDVPEKLLELMIVSPACFLTGPWAIYKVKIPSFSAIAGKYWPITNTLRDFPIFDLNQIKTVYSKVLNDTPKNEKLLYNKTIEDSII